MNTAITNTAPSVSIKPLMILARIEGLRAEKEYCQSMLNMHREQRSAKSEMVIGAMRTRISVIETEIESLLFAQ